MRHRIGIGAMFRRLLVILLLISAAHVACGQTITMDDYLHLVMTRHPFFQKERMQTDIEKAQRDRLLGNQDWTVTARPLLDYQEPVAAAAFVPEHAWVVGLGAALDRLFWENGGRLKLSWESSFTDQLLPDIVVPTPAGTMTIPIGPGEFYQHRVSASYSYPLLQNRGGLLDRIEYELGNFNVDFAEVQALENQEVFLLDVALRFLDWAAVAEEIRIGEERLRVSQDQLATVTRRRDAGLVDEVDVVRARDAVLAAKLNVVRSESRLAAKRAELAVIAQSDIIRETLPEFDLYALESLPPVEKAVGKIGEQRVVSALNVRLEQLAHQKIGIEETVKPQLYLSLVGALQEGDAGFGESLTLDKPELGVALDLRYPFGNRAARSDVAKTGLEIRKLEKEIESVSLDIEAEMKGLLTQIDELVKVMALNREQIETARVKTKEELKRYNQGRGELTFVIQSRDDEYVAQFVYALSAATYHQLVLAYRALADELLPR